MSFILEVIDRCEKAIGPDRDLDVAIVYALYPEIGAYRPHCQGEEPIFWHGPYRKQPCPRFTASIDAAAQLADGRAFTVGQNVHHHHWVASVNALDGDGAPTSLGSSNACKSPALALCAAALSARSFHPVGCPREQT